VSSFKSSNLIISTSC